MKATKPKLGELSREEKLELIRAIEEKDKRLRTRRAIYKPNRGQLPIHQSTKELICVFSANGAGKTAAAVHEAIWMALGYNPVQDKFTPVPAKIAVVLDRPEKVAQVWIPEIRKWFNLEPEQLRKDGKPYVSRLEFDNGSEIMFLFHEAEPLTFESIQISGAVFDEPPPRDVFIALRRGARVKGHDPRLIIIGTPIGATWLRAMIYEPWAKGELPDVDVIRMTIHVNEKNLTAGYIESFSKYLTEKEKRVRLEGEFWDLDGLAFGHLWKRDIHVMDPVSIPDNWNCVVAVDFHPRKPSTAVLIAASPDSEQMIVVSEFAARGAPSDYALKLSDWIESLGLLQRVRDVVCDSLGNSPLTGGSGELSFISVLNRTWTEELIPLRCRPTTYDEKSDEAAVQMIQESLLIPDEPDVLGYKLPKLRFFSNCRATIFDFENVSWMPVKGMELTKPKLDTRARDYFSCVKYALAAQPARSHRRGKIVRTAGRSAWSGSAGNKGDMRYNKRGWQQRYDDED